MSATLPGAMMVGMSIPRYASAAPDGVVTYANPFVFLAEDPRREAANGVTGDLGGWDVSDGFRLAEDFGESEWRISVLHDEVYAVLRKFRVNVATHSMALCGCSRRSRCRCVILFSNPSFHTRPSKS